ncbi:hypothetical protein NDK47_23825 [Brevibacillus ruminantium]|uniref:Uncharacterized protein n=1 Tax=Brevibacillus ruminantium TaxID=2950604 RepID=A0ABY4WD80_9BACL|nr:hypothetical protein [Brevibacillus ruminantium]USG65115.1 hypothetical protein NDK47_23825 [Brevibacillus ruminantium]
MKKDLLRNMLKELYEKSEEKERLIKDLQHLVCGVLDEIAGNLPAGTQIQMPIIGTVDIKRFTSNVGSKKWLTVKGAVLECGYPPESTFCLHGDSKCLITVASLSTFLSIANQLPTLIKKLQEREEWTSNLIRQGIENVTQFSMETDNSET